MFTYSTMVSGQELLHSEIKIAPIVVQEYLSGKTDLRVTVVGNNIFAVSITKQGDALVGDWRKGNKDNLDYTFVELPQTVKARIMALMQSLDLSFGGIDIALVRGVYYFIEVNPTGEWGWLRALVFLLINPL
jgi:glutathione synthase/RimK-type ligase-like ATP-grasp enzyme